MPRRIGHLTGEERHKLRKIIVHAGKLIDSAAGRLAQTPSDQLDQDGNSWWRNYDKWMKQHANAINYELDKFLDDHSPPEPQGLV